MDEHWITHEVDLHGDAADHLSREWLVTNGTGAYAMGTLPGVNTRRYHGLLIATAHPPVDRIVALNQLFERVTINGETHEPSTCMFREDSGRDTFVPAGLENLRRFTRGLDVAWTYDLGGAAFTRELSVHWKRQAATIRYTCDAPATLRIAPMLTLRDFHSLSPRDDEAFGVQHDGGKLIVKRGDAAVTLQCDGAAISDVKGDDRWWFGVHYPIDTRRGQEDTEDYFVPAAFEVKITPGNTVELTVALGADAKPSPTADLRQAASRKNHLTPMAAKLNDNALAIAADDFVVERTIRDTTLSTILAGYPWFADWGRDTFISLPGLLLATGRHDEARDTLHTYAMSIKDGLVPNRFDDYDATRAIYNNVDGSLWFIHAAMEYHDATGDDDSWNDWLVPAIKSIIEAYLRGTRGAGSEIRMAGDGLITAGDTETQLTWMDAKCDGIVFTPRQGKAVEINGLWFHALTGMSERLAQSDKRTSDHYKKLAGRVRRSFAKVFWDDELGYLRDHVWINEEGEEVADRSMRPNQVIVAAMEHAPMPRTKLTTMLKTVKAKLLTPFGLRTLPEDDKHYHPHYRGTQRERDEAYHQGTVWPWLIGPYAEGVLRVGQFKDDAKSEARETIAPLLEQLHGEGPFASLGQLHEIHEAASPHHPAGTMAQAWSVAQVIRVLKLIDQE